MRLDKKLMTAVATVAAVFSLGSTSSIADGHGKVPECAFYVGGLR